MTTTWEEQPLKPLLNSYDGLSNGEKASLRKLEHYEDAITTYAFFKVRNDCQIWVKQATTKPRWHYPDTVIAAILIFWRDRGAKTDLDSLQPDTTTSLGQLFSGDKRNKQETSDSYLPVKANRYQRLLRSETFAALFDELRRILRIFRHEPVNWQEVATLLRAFHYQDKPQIHSCKKRLNDGYFPRVIELKK